MPIEITILLATLFGLAVGSFLNVVIHRLPIMMQRDWSHQISAIQAELAGKEPPPEPDAYNLSIPRSACPHCGHKITALENIPVLSYLWLGGKCSACKTRISPRYPLIEALTGVLAGLAAWQFGWSFHTVAAFFFITCLITLTFIDLDTQFLPDDITLPLLWAGLLFSTFGGFTDIRSAVIGAATGYLTLWSVYWAFKLLTGKEGMGYGDFKLLAALGAWFGWKMLPAVLVLSSVAGTIVGVALMIFAKHGRNTPIPFGPYLALGGIAALFFGPVITQWYVR